MLKLFNFGPDMVRWVRVMLNGGMCIAQNRTTTEFFSIERGCRQGDCCSPLLFILCIELLGTATRGSDGISGYKINDVEIKIERFANDFTFIKYGSQDSFEKCLRIISGFTCISELSLNVEKNAASMDWGFSYTREHATFGFSHWRR